MTCDQCREREAVVQFTQVAGGRVTTLHLCEKCAAEKGVTTTEEVTKSAVGSLVAALGVAGPAAAALRAVEGGATCGGCGATLQDIRQTGRLGCAECYRVFDGALRDLLRRLHGATVHLGERYAAPGAVPSAARGEEVAALREQLRLAVETENFELAAELRDRLRAAE